MDFRHVVSHYLRHPWNWKSALFSVLMRAPIFFTANLSAGWEAAVAAATTEFLYRPFLAGAQGAGVQAFRLIEPGWLAALTASVLMPAISHTIEFLVHWIRGTENLKTSVAASVAFTILSTLFNLYAMRQGLFVVGRQGRSMLTDFRHLPRVIVGFLLVVPLSVWRVLNRKG